MSEELNNQNAPKEESLWDKLKNKASDAWEATKDAAEQARDKAEDLLDAAKDKAEEAWDKTKDIAGDLKDKAEDAWDKANHKDEGKPDPDKQA